MNDKQRVRAALSGRAVDRNPVTVLYNFLYYRDHFAELTGRPQHQVIEWLHAAPDEYVRTLCQLVEAAPLEMVQPEGAPSHEERANTEFVMVDGSRYQRDRRTGELKLLDTVSGFPVDYAANETQHVFTREDIREKVEVIPAEKQIAQGRMDYLRAAVAALGQDHYILSGGVIGTLYSCGWHVGQSNALAMLRSDPELIDYLCARITEQNIEQIRALAAAGRRCDLH